mgnify:CR=1 FL=1
MAEILETPKPKTLKLADGKEYELPALNLTTLANMEKTMGFGLAKLQEKMIESTAGTIRLAIYALLKETHPEMELVKTGELITFDVMKDVSRTLSEIVSISL